MPLYFESKFFNFYPEWYFAAIKPIDHEYKDFQFIIIFDTYVATNKFYSYYSLCDGHALHDINGELFIEMICHKNCIEMALYQNESSSEFKHWTIYETIYYNIDI